MKVVFLTPSNVAGGAERVLSSIANDFSNHNIKTWFIQFDRDSNFYNIEKKVKKLSLGIDSGKRKGIAKWIMFPKYFFSLRDILRQIKPDVVISFLFLTNMVGVLCCKELKIPIILSERNDPNEYSKKQRKAMKLIYPHSAGFVCQSDIVKEFIKTNYHIDNAIVIANPLNKSQIGEVKKIKKSTIISVGRLIPQKHFDLLIDAFADVALDFPEYTLSIYGEGPLRSELEKKIREYKLNERINLPGIKKDIIKENNDAKIFVLSSRFEGYPNVLVEAMANGMICIASDVPSGTVRQLIKHGENGFIYPVDDCKALVKLLKFVMNPDNDFSEIGYNATQIYEKTSIEKISSQWINYIEEILDEKIINI